MFIGPGWGWCEGRKSSAFFSEVDGQVWDEDYLFSHLLCFPISQPFPHLTFFQPDNQRATEKQEWVPLMEDTGLGESNFLVVDVGTSGRIARHLS